MITNFKIYEQESQPKYYRAILENLGYEVRFDPTGHFEKIDSSGKPVTQGIFPRRSDIPELCAAKYLGGAIWGLCSHAIIDEEIFDIHGHIEKIFIYEINEKPDLDLSNSNYFDFSIIEEVRYRRPVSGKFIGIYILTEENYEIFTNLLDEDAEHNWEDEMSKLKNYLKKMTI